MKNSEKILLIESMRDHAKEMVQHTAKKIGIAKAMGENTFTLEITHDAFERDYKALKYACKALQLLQDLVNDHEDNEQEVDNA
jgi:hypothetical protein